MKHFLLNVMSLGLLASTALTSQAQENILANKDIYPLGEAKTWTSSNGQEYTFITDDLAKLVAEPTNTSNVFLFPETGGGWDTPENRAIGIQGFYVDLGSSQSIGIVSTTWEGAAANDYDIYVTEVEPTVAVLGTEPTYSASRLGQYTDNTAVMPDNTKGRYIVFQATDATNWGWGVKIRSISATAPADDVLTTFKVSPGIVKANTETPVNLTILNQFGLDMQASDVEITVSDNATYSGGNLTVISGDSATFTATAGDATLTATVYVATAPDSPAATSIKTPIYTNTATDYNSYAEFTTAYNGGAQKLGELTFENGEVAQQFGSTRCVFFSNSETTGAWNGNIDPAANGYRNLCLDVFSALDVDCTIEFESVENLEAGHTYPFTLKSGQWNSISVNVAGATKLGNLSIRFSEVNADDILLANIYFSPTYIEGDEEAPVLGEISYVASKTSVELTLTATDDLSTDIYYSITDGTKTYSVSGESEKTINYTISGLEPSTTYNFTVTASDGKNISEPKEIEIKTLGLPSAPAPTVDEENVVAIYSTGYGITELPTFDSWTSSATMGTVKTENGEYALSFENYMNQWGGLINLDLDVEHATHLYLDIFSETVGSVDIAPVWNDADGNTPGYTVTISKENVGQWTTVTIPVETFGYPDYGYNVIQIALTESSLSSFALDNLYFAGDSALAVEIFDKTAAEKQGGVYNLQGIRVAADASALENLPAGLYIVGGKKIIKR